jgi:hypothetical protein
MFLGLQSYLQGKDRVAKVLIRMKLLWISDHTYGQYKLIRLHLVDARAPEPLEDMLRVRCQHQAFNSERIHLIFQCRYRYFKPHTRPIGRTSTHCCSPQHYGIWGAIPSTCLSLGQSLTSRITLTCNYTVKCSVNSPRG